MRLTSSDFHDGAELDARHGKLFDNLAPQLTCSDVPTAAGSLALSMVDTHPVARGYVHWLVDGIPPTVGEIAADGRIRVGRELQPYAGPFPPPGKHDYVFTLYALDRFAPSAPPQTTLAAFLEMMQGHVLETATLSASFTTPRA